MPVPKIKTYPAKATNKVWQSKKSFLDKSKAKKTGLGPKLEAAEKAWAKIDWDGVDISKVKPKTFKEAQAAVAESEKAFKLLDAADSAVMKAAGDAAIAGKNSALTKPSRDAANEISRLLNDALDRLREPKREEFLMLAMRVQAEADLRTNLVDVEIFAKKALIATAPTATRPNTNTVEVTKMNWTLDGGRHLTLRGQKLTVRAKHKDGSLFINDMTLTEIDKAAATFKS